MAGVINWYIAEWWCLGLVFSGGGDGGDCDGAEGVYSSSGVCLSHGFLGRVTTYQF